MKKIAVLLPWMKMGGTNKIAVNFLKELSQYCEVTLILSENSGELLNDLSKDIRVLIDEMQSFQSIFKYDATHLKIGYLVKDILYYSKIKLGKDNIDNYKYIVDRHQSVTSETFDCAISYHGQSPERLLNLLYRINSKKKVVWIHGEMSFDQDKLNRLKKYYKQIDHFFFVSNPTKESFKEIYPIEEKKCTVYYNPIDRIEILEKSNKECNPKFPANVYKLLTVGRISSEKGQDMIPHIARKLVDLGHNLCWYLIGDGDNRSVVENKIKEFKVEKFVKILGVKTNPYCYMRECDIYIQPSYTEGFSTTICEAAMLGKAIIGTTPSGGIKDQITHGIDGLIVDASVDALAEGINYIFVNQDIKYEFEKNILSKNFEGKNEIEKFLNYLNN